MIWLLRVAGWLLTALALFACRPPVSATSPVVAGPEVVAQPVEVAATPADPNWGEAGDCRQMLGLLQAGLVDGRIADLEGTPFALIDRGLASGRSEWSRFVGTRGRDDMSGLPPLEVRCVIRVDRALDRRSDHKVIGREQVRSRYQSGTRSEKNPAYEVAQIRLRQAEKAAKPGKSSIIKVGDPLIDLFGTLIGGALTGVGQWGAGDQLEEALDTLMATSPSIEQPVYKTYHFERARVRASREATLPVVMTDRRLQRSWRTSLKRREVRDLTVVTGLDRQDEDHARHSQDSLTESGLKQWLVEAPSLPLIDITAGLLEHASPAPLDRIALEGMDQPAVAAELFAEADVADAASMPKRLRPLVKADGSDRRPAADRTPRPQIRLIGETSEAEGVFVAPHFVLTPSGVIGERGLIDIEEAPGHRALGLVAAVDHGLGLALVQSPSAGQPVAIGAAEGSGSQSAGAVIAPSTGSSPMPDSSHKGDGGPLLLGGRLVGFTVPGGPDIGPDAIHLFLDHQRHLLPPEPSPDISLR